MAFAFVYTYGSAILRVSKINRKEIAMKTLLTFATVAFAAASLVAGPKEGREPGPRGRRGGMEGGSSDPVVRLVCNPKVAEKIGLSEEQRGKIKEINKANRDNSEDLRKALRDAMEKQAELLKADKIDEAAVMAEIDKAFDARKEMAKRQTRRVIAIKAVLTPEQVSKALEILKERPQSKLDRRGTGPRGDKPSPESKD